MWSRRSQLRATLCLRGAGPLARLACGRSFDVCVVQHDNACRTDSAVTRVIAMPEERRIPLLLRAAVGGQYHGSFDDRLLGR